MNNGLANTKKLFYLKYLILIGIVSIFFSGCLNSSLDVDKGMDSKALLYLAIEKEDVEQVKYLIENGSDVNNIEDNEYSPLILACKIGNFEIIKILI